MTRQYKPLLLLSLIFLTVGSMFSMTDILLTAQTFQRVAPNLMLAGDRAAFKQMLLRPCHGWTGGYFR